jgi:hypothetical protein
MQFDLSTILTPIVISAAAAWLIRNKTKSEVSKNKAETEILFDKRYQDLIETMDKERAHDRQLIEDNRQLIKQQAHENAECEYKHEVTELELATVKKKIDFHNWQRETVFILDDNPLVVNEFKYRFGKISVLDTRVFSNSEKFLTDARNEKPEILIIDWMLGEDETAQDVIEQLEYEPEIFIMSADKSVALKIREQGMQFFYKDDHYVFKIAKAVIQHLRDKN